MLLRVLREALQAAARETLRLCRLSKPAQAGFSPERANLPWDRPAEYCPGACRATARPRGSSRFQIQGGQPLALRWADTQRGMQVLMYATIVGIDCLQCGFQKVFLHAPEYLQHLLR